MSRLLIILGGLARSLRPRTARSHVASPTSNVSLLPRFERLFDHESEIA